MTWDAQRGPTVLQGEESQIFAEAIAEICNSILLVEDGYNGCFDFAPVLFSRMSTTQQAASLELVTKALFVESETPLELVAWNEATLATILRQIRDSLFFELADFESQSTRLRSFLNRQTDSELVLDENSLDDDEWEVAWDCYESQFLWDNDFEMEELMDCDPEASREIQAIMGIDSDYQASIPPDLRADDDLRACLERIATVIRGGC